MNRGSTKLEETSPKTDNSRRSGLLVLKFCIEETVSRQFVLTVLLRHNEFLEAQARPTEGSDWWSNSEGSGVAGCCKPPLFISIHLELVSCGPIN